MKCANCYNAVAEMLEPKEETIRQQKATIERLTRQRDRLVNAVKDIYTNKNLRRCESVRVLIAEIEASNE